MESASCHTGMWHAKILTTTMKVNADLKYELLAKKQIINNTEDLNTDLTHGRKTKINDYLFTQHRYDAGSKYFPRNYTTQVQIEGL